MAETERFEKQSFDFLHLFLCYSVLFSSLSRFLSTYSTYSFGCFYRDCCHVAVSPSNVHVHDHVTFDRVTKNFPQVTAVVTNGSCKTPYICKKSIP